MSLSPDYTFLIQLASFFVLLFFLGRYLFGPFQALLLEREARTTGDSGLAESYQAEAEATGQRLESEMAKARAAAMSEAEKIRTADRAQEAGRRLAEIRAEVEVERNRTLDELGTEAEAMASQMVSAVLGPAGELR
jgi:F-type H+-transporting ATPase subunit b